MFKKNKQMLHFLLSIFSFLKNEIKTHFHKILKLNKHLFYLQNNYVVLICDDNQDYVKSLFHALNTLLLKFIIALL